MPAFLEIGAAQVQKGCLFPAWLRAEDLAGGCDEGGASYDPLPEITTGTTVTAGLLQLPEVDLSEPGAGMAVASPGGLDDGIQGGKVAVYNGKADVYTGFDELGGDYYQRFAAAQ